MGDLYLRTSIRKEAAETTRKKGWKVALAAAFFIAASEYLLPLFEIAPLGIWSWLIGTSAAGLGALPHQMLKNQDKNPDILHGTEKTLSFFQANKSLFTLAWNEIESFHYVDNGKDYGLAFHLKTPLEGISDKCRERHGVDLFLPYFSEGSYMMLEKWRTQHVT
ncbi:MAG: hypothetical protein JSS12_09700 [Verrucomicrobia bacterium]|nr:hypothetical protein [Verrucomicrobiota bacterium]